MKNSIVVVCGVLALAGMYAWAGKPAELGVMSSQERILVNGKEHDFKGIPSVPLHSGDNLEVTLASGRARFLDSNRVEFDPLSKAKVLRYRDGHVYVLLSKGGVRFQPVVGKLYICAAHRLFTPPEDATGFVVIEKENKVLAHDDRNSVDQQGRKHCDESGPVLYWVGTPQAVAIVGGVAAATAVPVLTRGDDAPPSPDSVSPSGLGRP